MQYAPQQNQKLKIAFRTVGEPDEGKVKQLEQQILDLNNNLCDIVQEFEDEVDDLQKQNATLIRIAHDNSIELNRTKRQKAQLQQTMNEERVQHQDRKCKLDLQMAGNENLRKRLAALGEVVNGSETDPDINGNPTRGLSFPIRSASESVSEAH